MAAALLTRAWLVYGFEVTQSSDCQWYFSRALELLKTGRYAENGVSTAFWPVGYPGFLAGTLWLLGPTVKSGQFANLMLSLGCIALVCHWAWRWFDDARVGVAAAWGLALYPNHMGYSVGLYSEPLYTLLLLAILCLTVARPPSAWRHAAVGLLLGLAMLVKAQTMLLAPVLALLLAWQGGLSTAALMRAIGGAAITLLVMAATVAPWTARNFQVLGAVVPVSTNGGMSLLSGNNPSMTTSLGKDFDDTDPLVLGVKFSVADQVQADRRAKDAAFRWIADHPGRFLALVPKKLFRFWVPDGESEWTFQAGYARYEEFRLWFRTVRLANQAYYMLALVAGLAAMVRLAKWRQPSTLVPLFIVVYFSAISAVFSGQSRYHAPLMPLVVAFAAWACLRWRSHSSRGAA